MSNIITSKLDANQVIRKAYDDDTNRLRVDAQVSATISDIDIVIDATAGDNIAITDPTGTNYLLPNSDGSLNVVVTDYGGLNLQNVYNELLVNSGVLTTLITFTAVSPGKLIKADVAGENIAQYTVLKNGLKQSKKYTYFQNLNEVFNFMAGLDFTTSDIITIQVLHNRPDPANFNCNLLIAT